MDNKQRESWKNLNDTERQQSATAIIVSMETMALEVAATIDEPMTIATSEDNICKFVRSVKWLLCCSVFLPEFYCGYEKGN